MERNREAKRSSTMVAAVGLSRRRCKTISTQNPIEGARPDLLATVRSRESTNKRDRENNLTCRNKRIRGGADRVDLEADEDEEGEESDGESFGSEEDDDVEDGNGVPRTLSLSITDLASNHNNIRSPLPPRLSKRSCKVTDDMMIGVPIPRKTRSASAKRSHENTSSGTCGRREGFGEEKSHRSKSNSTQTSYADLVSPFSSRISDTKKIKSAGSNARTAPSSHEDDIEFEIAEVLSGLMKQHQTSENHESPKQSSRKTEPQKINHIGHESKCSIPLPFANSSQTTPPTLVLCHSDNLPSDPSHDDGMKNIKMNNDSAKSSASVENDLLAGDVHRESEQLVDLKTYPNKTEMVSKFHEDPSEAFHDIFALEGTKLSPSSLVKGDEFQDSTVKKEFLRISSMEIQRKEKLKFDLMVSPPNSSSPVGDDLSDSFSEPKPNANILFNCEKKVERSPMKITILEEMQEKKSEEKISEKLNLSLEKQHPDDNLKLQLQDPKQQSGKTVTKVGKNDKSCLLPMAIDSDHSYNNLPSFGCVAAAQVGSQLSTMAQPPQSHLFQPRVKRCVTHYYIAQDIYSHQQFTKMNSFSEALNGSQGIKLAAANFSNHGGNNKSIEIINFIDGVQEKQPELREVQPATTGDLVHVLALPTPPSQHKTRSPATINQPGDLKSAKSLNMTPLSGKPVVGALPPFSAQPTTFSFSYSNSSMNQALPYVAILPNQGIPIPTSPPFGSTIGYKPSSSPQGMPFLNGSWYPPHMSHHSQLHHQPPSQPIHLSTNSSSSRKQPQIQHPWNVQATGNNNYLLASIDKQPQQYVPQSNQACKAEETTRNNAAPNSHSKTLNSQMLNFSLGPTMSGGEEGRNHGENQHNQKLQSNDSKGKVELVPSQQVSLQFTSLNGNGLPSSLNFATVAQNPTIFQNLPDQALASAPQKKSLHDEYNKKGNSLVFNHQSTTLNFMQPPPSSGNWPHLPVTSTAVLAKGSTADRTTCSHNVKSPKNVIAFQQPLIKCNSSVQSCQPKNSGRRSMSSLVHVQQGKAPRGQTQISFGGNHKISLVTEATNSK